MSRYHFPAGTLASSGRDVHLAAGLAGWSYCGLEVVTIHPGGTTSVWLEGVEAAVIPLRGPADLDVDGTTLHLDGRASVFAAVTDWAYAPAGSALTLRSELGAQLAIATAVATERFPAVRIPAASVPIEIRGAGQATRQVNNYMSPDVFPAAHRLMCVEVLTPDGNWSSYPPHKHDDSPECVVNNEEIYYFRIGRTGSEETSQDGFALHRLYTGDGAVDEQVAVRDGDVFCIPRGYHGPSAACPGYPLYYLNVLAGPGAQRSMAFCDDPAHAWVRTGWDGMATDPRCPMTGPAAAPS